MTRILRVAPEYLLFTVALAWPLDLFQYVPVLDVTVIGLITVLLAVLAVWDIASGKKLRVPFEALWPASALFILLAVVAYRGESAVPLEVPGALLLFILSAHFASSRASIEGWLRASVFSATAVVLITLATHATGLMPTAYSLQLPTTFTFAYDLHSGVHILALGLAFAVFTAANPGEHHVLRTIATGSILLLGGTLAAKGLELAIERPVVSFDTYFDTSPLVLTGCIIAAWLFVRVLAKVEVDRRERPTRTHFLFWTMAVATVLVIVFGPFPPRLYHGYLLGLACGYALPERPTASTLTWPKAATALLAGLLLLNPWIVFPAHEQDPRNYEVAASRDFVRGDYDTLLERLDYVDAHSPNELRTHLWRARAALKLGDANRASMEFVASLPTEDDAHRRLLPGPTEAERADFVVQLRDLSSTLPEDQAVCAYERALVALGDRGLAVYSLQLLTNIALVHAEGVDTAAFAEAAAFIVGDETLQADFAAWSTDELLTLLTQWGAVIDAAPEELPPSALPAIFVLQRRLSSLEVFTALGPTRQTFHESFAPRPSPSRSGEVSEIAWGRVARAEGAGLTVPLLMPGLEGPREGGVLEIAEDGKLLFQWTLDPDPLVPFTPAIRIYLP